MSDQPEPEIPHPKEIREMWRKRREKDNMKMMKREEERIRKESQSLAQFKQKYSTVSFTNFTECINRIKTQNNIKCDWMHPDESDKLRAAGYRVRYYGDYNDCGIPFTFEDNDEFVRNMKIAVGVPEPKSIFSRFWFW